jgi:hypothetical protein
MTFYSEDLEVDGIIKHSQEENILVAIINSDNIRQAEEIKVSKRKFLDFLETLTHTFVVLHNLLKFVHTSKPDDKRLIQNDLEDLLDAMKDDIKYIFFRLPLLMTKTLAIMNFISNL